MKKIAILILLFSINSLTYATVNSSMPVANNLTTVSVTASECNAPCQLIKSSSDSVVNSINQNYGKQQTLKLIQTSVLPQFDFTLITKLVMGQNWKIATSGQQEQIVPLFRDMLVYSYATALNKFKGAAIAITNSAIDANKTNKAVVMTQVKLPNNENMVSIEYDLAKISNAWKIYDIKIENASIVTTYRSQFNDTVQSSGINGLINLLQTKVKALQQKA